MNEALQQVFVGTGKSENPNQGLTKRIKRAFIPKYAKEHWYAAHEKEINELHVIEAQLTPEERKAAIEKLEQRAQRGALTKVAISWTTLAVVLGAAYVGGRAVLDPAFADRLKKRFQIPIKDKNSAVKATKPPSPLKRETSVIPEKSTTKQIAPSNATLEKPVELPSKSGNIPIPTDLLLHAETGKGVISTVVQPKILEHAKFYRGGVPSEFYELAYTPGMNRWSKELRDSIRVSLNCPPDTVTFGYWSFTPEMKGTIQAMNRVENAFGSAGTNRPFVQTRYGIFNPGQLRELYAHGIRPLTGMLVEADPKHPFSLQIYNAVTGEINGSRTLKTDVDALISLHQNPTFRNLAIQATEAVLKKLSYIKNPVIVEHAGELSPPVVASLIDTVNLLVTAINPTIKVVNAVSVPSLDNNSLADLIVRNVKLPLATTLYPSYTINRAGSANAILHHATIDPVSRVAEVSRIYDALHKNSAGWLKNHASILR